MLRLRRDGDGIHGAIVRTCGYRSFVPADDAADPVLAVDLTGKGTAAYLSGERIVPDNTADSLNA